MYRRGLGRGQIAEQSGALARTVGYHLSVARKLQPGLEAEHHAAAARKPRRVTGRGLERMSQLIALVQAGGQYPSTKSVDRDERALAAWLNRRRQTARDGTLEPASVVGQVSCQVGRIRPGLSAMRPDGRSALLPWWSTGDPDRTGPGTSPISRASSMSSVCGFTPSGSRPAGASWIQPNWLPWTSGSQAGDQAGPEAKTPGHVSVPFRRPELDLDRLKQDGCGPLCSYSVTFPLPHFAGRQFRKPLRRMSLT